MSPSPPQTHCRSRPSPLNNNNINSHQRSDEDEAAEEERRRLHLVLRQVGLHAVVHAERVQAENERADVQVSVGQCSSKWAFYLLSDDNGLLSKLKKVTLNN